MEMFTGAAEDTATRAAAAAIERRGDAMAKEIKLWGLAGSCEVEEGR